MDLRPILLAASAMAISCAASETNEHFPDLKSDTGYVGSRAVEMNATFTGSIHIDVPDRSPEELETMAVRLLGNSRQVDRRIVFGPIGEQVKYARNALKAESFDLNLEHGSGKLTEVVAVEGGLDIQYSKTVESLVRISDLEEEGKTPEDLVGKVVTVQLPATPNNFFDRAGIACTKDAADDVNAASFFYYFDPDAEDCTLEADDLITAAYTVTSSQSAPNVYPEYDSLVADGRISMGVIFGQIDHGVLKTKDPGFRYYDDMLEAFEDLDFAVLKTYPQDRGHLLHRRYPGGLEVTINMLTPIGFADDVDEKQALSRFQDVLRDNEIVYYNGHAFYGSLNALKDVDAYPINTYQIINMDACWSYAYYTKQILQNKATASDPVEHALVDIVNNTEPGYMGSQATALALYELIFDASARVYAGKDASKFTWNSMITIMNLKAQIAAIDRTGDIEKSEIYGVSGVTQNMWRP